MSKVDETILRQYFEGNRFLVRPWRKEVVAPKKKPGDEDLDLLVFNPEFQAGGRKPDFFLFSSELPRIEWAVVTLGRWRAPRFTPALLTSGAKLFRFLEQTVGQGLEKPTTSDVPGGGSGNPLWILVLPGLPTAEPYRSQSVELLRSRGVDGIISFRSMLLEIISRVKVSHNHPDSEILEFIRVLKNYDLLADSQLELFGGR
jgi:hypothetical protein